MSLFSCVHVRTMACQINTHVPMHRLRWLPNTPHPVLAVQPPRSSRLMVNVLRNCTVIVVHGSDAVLGRIRDDVYTMCANVGAIHTCHCSHFFTTHTGCSNKRVPLQQPTHLPPPWLRNHLHPLLTLAQHASSGGSVLYRGGCSSSMRNCRSARFSHAPLASMHQR